MNSTKLVYILVGVILATPLLGIDHIPPNNGTHHGTRNCRGYAVGRAFGLTSWSSGCRLDNLGLGVISSLYFDIEQGPLSLSQVLYAVQTGDIILWGGGNHAAYVESAPEYQQPTIQNIIISQVRVTGGSLDENKTLAQAIGWAGENPDGYARRLESNVFYVEAENSFSGGQIKIGGTTATSPLTVTTDWDTKPVLDAVADGVTEPTFRPLFYEWQDAEEVHLVYTKTYQTPAHKSNGTLEFTADFDIEYDATFENSFVGVGTPGVIKVSDTQYAAPKTVGVMETYSVSAEALNQNINGIAYTFTQWKVGSTQVSTNRVETFTPSSHTTYTAYFAGKPNQVTNFRCDTYEVGELLHFLWTENPNPNVKYRVYRKPKYGEEDQGPTLNHGTSDWTDPDWALASGRGFPLRSWDVRSYYTIEDAEATAQWFTRFARPQAKRIAEGAAGMPEEFSIRNHPNPFNPSTTIQVAIPKEASVLLKVYDLLGREVAELVKGDMAAGYHQVPWSGVDHSGQRVPSGIYIAVLVSPQYTKSIKMLLLE